MSKRRQKRILDEPENLESKYPDPATRPGASRFTDPSRIVVLNDDNRDELRMRTGRLKYESITELLIANGDWETLRRYKERYAEFAPPNEVIITRKDGSGIE